MALYAYPIELPGPGPGNVAVAERRHLSDVPGFQQVRQVQQDYLATQDLDFIFTAAQATTFYLWWRDRLKRGGLWFVAAWPLPKSWALATRRFIEPPVWDHISGGSWHVTAKTQIRGIGILPDDGFGSACTPDGRTAIPGLAIPGCMIPGFIDSLSTFEPI